MKSLAIVPLFFLLSSFSLPDSLDFGEIKKGCSKTNENFWEMGLLAFNGAPEISALFVYLKHIYDVTTVVETGTFQGNSTIFFSYLFDEVHTIEIGQKVYNSSKQNLSKQPNIHCHFGSSDKVLKQLLPTLGNKRVLFYLDAHWQQHWPLRNELIEISKTHHDNCIIVIDDCQVPGRKDIPFDRYGEHTCSYPYFKAQLDKVFSNYTMHYIIPQATASRAKFLAIPTRFAKKK